MITILLVAALQTAPAAATDPAKYRGILLAGAKIEGGWRTGLSLIDYQNSVKDFAAERLLVSTNDPRLDRILEQTESLLAAGAVLWRAKIFENQRSDATSAAELVGTGLVAWDNEFKFRAAIDDGVALIRAFRQIVNADGVGGFKLAEDTLANIRVRVERESPEAVAKRNKAAAEAVRASQVPLSAEELETFKARLISADNSVKAAAVAAELSRRGPAGMKPLAPLLMALLKGTHEAYVRMAIFDALKNMRGEAREVLPDLKAFVAQTQSLYGKDVVIAIETDAPAKE